MSKLLLSLILFSICAIGTMLISGQTTPLTSTVIDSGNQGSPHHRSISHPHQPLNIDDWEKAPQVAIAAIQDEHTQGWAINVEVVNFSFSPETVNQNNVKNKGHGHLYIDGEKITRLYSDWIYLDQLPRGKHSLKVTLNSNQHQQLVRNGKPITAEVRIFQR